MLVNLEKHKYNELVQPGHCIHITGFAITRTYSVQRNNIVQEIRLDLQKHKYVSLIRSGYYTHTTLISVSILCNTQRNSIL